MTVDQIHAAGASMEALYTRIDHMLDGVDPALAGAVEHAIAAAREAYCRLVVEHLNRLQELKAARFHVRVEEERNAALMHVVHRHHALATLQTMAVN